MCCSRERQRCHGFLPCWKTGDLRSWHLSWWRPLRSHRKERSRDWGPSSPIFFSTPHGEKMGKKLGKKLAKNGKNCVIPWYLDIFIYIHHENLYTDSILWWKRLKSWYGMGLQILNMFEPTIATAPPALRSVIPASHHCAPFAKSVYFCVETTLGAL